MFGTFQQSQIRIEISASAADLADALLYPDRLQRWLWPQSFSGAPDKLISGTRFTSQLGPIALKHYVELSTDDRLRVLLAESIDGFHEWYWGDGWVQSRLEGVSLLPLKLVQSTSLMRLRAFVADDDSPELSDPPDASDKAAQSDRQSDRQPEANRNPDAKRDPKSSATADAGE